MTVLSERWNLGAQFLSNTGAPLAGGSLTYYQAATSNLQAVFSDSGGSNSLGSLVTLDAAGRTTTAIFFGDAPTYTTYKEVLKDSAGAVIYTQDNIPQTAASVTPVSSATATWPEASISTSTALTAAAFTGYRTDVTTSGGSVVITLPSAVTVGNGLQGVIRKVSAANSVTIATEGGQTINGASSITLTANNESALIISDGANFAALKLYADGAIPGAALAANCFSGLTAETAANFSRTSDKIPLFSNASSANASLSPKYFEGARYPSIQSGSIVINSTTTTPPGSPSEFDAYIVATGATGAWSGKAGNIAIYVNSAWMYFVPSTGYRIFDVATSSYYVWNGTAWVRDLGLTIQNFQTTAYGGTLQLKYWSELVTLSGATTDTSAVLPNQSLPICVSARVVTLITSAAGSKWNIRYVGGSTGTGSAYGNTLGFAAGTTSQGMSGSARYGEAVRIACAQADGSETGSTFTGGTVRVEAWYFEVTPPTS